MTSARNDMPPRQPNENEPADHLVRDELDTIEEAVARISDADVEKHLRTVLDQARYRPRHAPGAQPPSGTLDRPAATRRGRWLSWFLIALSGAALEIVDQVPVERAKFESRGLAVLLSSVIAAVSMWFALTAATGVNGIAAAPAGLLWGLAVMGIDRWLVTTMPLGRKWRRLAAVVPRLLLALLLSALISAPMVLHLFQQPIDGQISAIRQQQKHSAFVASSQYGRLSQQVTSLQTRVRDLSEVIVVDSYDLAPLAPSADPRLQGLIADQTLQVALELQYIQVMAGEEFTEPADHAPQRVANAYQNAIGLVQATAKVSELTSQIKARAEQLITPGTAAAKTRLKQARKELPAVKEALTAAQAKLAALREKFHAQHTTGGVLIILKALGQLSDLTALSASLLFLLFLMIECLPVTVALGQRPGGYEKILARMIVDERLKIEPAAQEHLQPAAARPEDLSAPLPAEVADDGPGRPDGTLSAQPGRGTESVTVPDHLRNEIESIDPFRKDMTEKAEPAYREELENCLVAISQAVNELRRKGFDSDQIAEALRITAITAGFSATTAVLAAHWARSAAARG